MIDLFWNYWREFSVCYGRKAKQGGTLNGVLSKAVSVEPECSEVINGPNLGGFLGLAPDL